MSDTTVTNPKPARRPYTRRQRLTPTEKLVASALLTQKKRPLTLVAAAFGVSEATCRRLRQQGEVVA